MSHHIVHTYEEACQAVEQLGILPFSGFIPDHPALDSLTRPEAWHTGKETDPWHWRDRFPSEGKAAYGRFIGPRPVLVAQDIFPLLKSLLTPPKSVEERYTAGLLARPAVQIYNIIQENTGIEVRLLRKQAGMQDTSSKAAFDHALRDLQNTADIVISGVAENANGQGTKSGWNGTCYMLAEDWMKKHRIEPFLFTRTDARTQLFAWLKPRWAESAVRYLERKLVYQGIFSP